MWTDDTCLNPSHRVLRKVMRTTGVFRGAGLYDLGRRPEVAADLGAGEPEATG